MGDDHDFLGLCFHQDIPRPNKQKANMQLRWIDTKQTIGRLERQDAWGDMKTLWAVIQGIKLAARFTSNNWGASWAVVISDKNGYYFADTVHACVGCKNITQWG